MKEERKIALENNDREKLKNLTDEQLIGYTFGRLKIIGYVGRDSKNYKLYQCECVCGNKVTLRRYNILGARVLSCGCLQKDVVSEISKQSKKRFEEKHFISSWQNMCARAKDPNYSGYTPNFNWTYEQYKNDMYESYLVHVDKYGEKQTTLDRIDSKKGYYKENCRWATRLEQNYNLSTNILVEYNGLVMNFLEWKKYFNSDLDITLIKQRVKTYGWNIERACTEPVNTKFRRKQQ